MLYIHMLYTREWINNAIGKLLKGEINHHSQLASQMPLHRCASTKFDRFASPDPGRALKIVKNR